MKHQASRLGTHCRIEGIALPKTIIFPSQYLLWLELTIQVILFGCLNRQEGVSTRDPILTNL